MSKNNILKSYDNIKKYYINLDKRTDRRENIESQVGKDFTRVSAIVGVDLTPEEIEKTFDLHTAKKKYNVTLTNGQIACTLSHFKIYQEVDQDNTIKDSDFVLISEDDNKFTDQFSIKLNQMLQFLSQDRFKNVNMVLLRYHGFTHFVDFVPDDFKLDYHRLDYYKHQQRKQYISTNVYGDAKAHKKSQFFSFEYDDKVNHDQNETLFSKTQHLIALSSLLPYSSACYLIRKSAIKTIVNKFKKPFWITDDFKAIVPTHTILLASPLLAVEQNEVSATDIQNPQAQQNTNNTTIFTKYEYRSMRRLKKIPGIYPLIYAKNSFNRYLGKLLLKSLNLEKIDHKEYYHPDIKI